MRTIIILGTVTFLDCHMSIETGENREYAIIPLMIGIPWIDTRNATSITVFKNRIFRNF